MGENLNLDLTLYFWGGIVAVGLLDCGVGEEIECKVTDFFVGVLYFVRGDFFTGGWWGEKCAWAGIR